MRGTKTLKAPNKAKSSRFPQSIKDHQSLLSKDHPILDKPEINQKSNTIVISDEIILIDINLIEPDPDQPRKWFDLETLTNLQNSIESSAFIKHLEKSATIKLIDSQKIEFKSRLTTIQDLFKQILS